MEHNFLIAGAESPCKTFVSFVGELMHGVSNYDIVDVFWVLCVGL